MNSPHPKAFFARLTGSWKQLLKSWYMFFFLCPTIPEMGLKANDMQMLISMLTDPSTTGCTDPGAFTAEDIEAWKYTFQQPNALTGPINYYRAAFRSPPPKRTEKTGESKNGPPGIVQPPTLIIWGTNDAALSTELAHDSLQFCQKGTLRLIEGASHWVQQDRPGLCNQLIRDFLRD